ncbi:hypothetical protein ZTR_10361 [Talaromyces verruculosus]|nr:hypothetical protein ZTR_10361 [Talaromyces verruculosus]
MKITLDEIIPYQPPLPPKPSKPSISSKIIPPPSKLPPLIHPLPQKPHSRHQSPSYPSQLHQSKCGPISYPIDQERRSGLPTYTNDFDSELAALSNMTIEATAIASPATENAEQQQHVSSGKGLKTGPYKFPPRSRSDNEQDARHDDEANHGISAEVTEHGRSCSAYQETTEPTNGSKSNSMHSALSPNARSGKAIPADTAHLDEVNLPHASSPAPELTESLNITLLTESVDDQGVLCEKRTPDPDISPLDMILSESRETSLVVLNNEDNEDISNSLGGEHPTTNTTLGCSQDLSLSSREQNGACLGENNTVSVVIPAAQPPKPRTRKSAKRPHRRRSKKRASGTAPFDERDDSDDPDDDDYVEKTPQVDDWYRSTKKPRQLPVTNSDRSDVGAAVGFQLGAKEMVEAR